MNSQKENGVIAYHFTSNTLRDGRPIPPVGETLVHDGPVEMCKSGLHASEHPFDAFSLAPWVVLFHTSRPLRPILHRTRCEDIVMQIPQKLVCRCRTILESADATQMLRRLAADYAFSVADRWDMPQVVGEYLTTWDKEKRMPALSELINCAPKVFSDYIKNSVEDNLTKNDMWYAFLYAATVFAIVADTGTEKYSKVITAKIVMDCTTRSRLNAKGKFADAWNEVWDDIRNDFQHRANSLFHDSESS